MSYIYKDEFTINDYFLKYYSISFGYESALEEG